MLNYSNTHRKDPKTKSNAFWCAVTLSSIFIVGFLLINYYEAVFSGIVYVLSGIWHGISISFVATANFLKPVFESVGGYILSALSFLLLWSICVYTKTEKTCIQSVKDWRNISFSIMTILLLYLALYMVYFDINFERIPKHVQLYPLICWVCLFSGIYIFSTTKESIDQYKH